MLRVVYVCLILFNLSCAKKEANQIPNDISSAENKDLLNTYLNEIQTILSQEGSSVDLARLPVIVSNLNDGVAGQCIDKKTIVLNKELFEGDDLDEGLDQISTLWAVLLHEIGHCYFGKNHYEKDIFPPNGHEFKTIFNVKFDDNYPCFPLYRNVWRGTVMYTDHQIFIVPQAMKRYYVKELLGEFPAPTFNDILIPQKIEIIDKSLIPVPEESVDEISCN